MSNDNHMPNIAPVMAVTPAVDAFLKANNSIEDLNQTMDPNDSNTVRIVINNMFDLKKVTEKYSIVEESILKTNILLKELKVKKTMLENSILLYMESNEIDELVDGSTTINFIHIEKQSTTSLKIMKQIFDECEIDKTVSENYFKKLSLYRMSNKTPQKKIRIQTDLTREIEKQHKKIKELKRKLYSNKDEE